LNYIVKIIRCYVGYIYFLRSIGSSCDRKVDLASVNFNGTALTTYPIWNVSSCSSSGPDDPPESGGSVILNISVIINKFYINFLI
jgi:hypothetical protein